MDKIFSNGVLTVINDAGETLVLNKHPSKRTPWFSEEEALSLPISDKYVFSTPIMRDTISPVRLKMLFTREERLKLRELELTDPGIKDLFDILDDLRTTSIDLNLPTVQELIGYAIDLLVAENIVTNKAERLEQVLSNGG